MSTSVHYCLKTQLKNVAKMLAISGAVQPSPFLTLIGTCQKDNMSKWIKPHEKRKRLHEFLFPFSLIVEFTFGRK